MYCFCGREAFGDMIACENPDVSLILDSFHMILLLRYGPAPAVPY